ncbi:O-antigen ligase family protein [Candidatus Thioglobus sp.]|nr:O-antigen ligase family protein [Candidatus Thioglobus sp.]
MTEVQNLDRTYQYLLIALAFVFPLTVFGGNLIIVIISLIWLFSANYKNKFKEIISSKLMIASIIFFLIHALGLIWTEDISWGLHILHKMWYFLLFFPILYTIVKKEYIRYYVIAFIASIAFTEILSYLVWFELIPPFRAATVENPTPFMSHISYNPILAFSIYLVSHEFFFNKGLSKFNFFLYSFLMVSMSINMFITGGRAGQVAFFTMLIILIFQFFNNQKVKSLFTTLIIIPIIFFSAYQTSDLFKNRVNDAIHNIIQYEDNRYTPVGLRITFARNSLYLIKENPIIGVGTGDFPSEYRRINALYDSVQPDTTNPHNMYVLILTQLGLIGLISMLSIFYYQIKLSFKSQNRFIRDAGITLPILFLALMWSDSYILGHFTTLMFVFFSSFLYKDFDKN